MCLIDQIFPDGLFPFLEDGFRDFDEGIMLLGSQGGDGDTMPFNFLHKDYAFVLGRQMMALGRFPDVILENAVYLSAENNVIVYKDMASALAFLEKSISQNKADADKMQDAANQLFEDYDADSPNV